VTVVPELLPLFPLESVLAPGQPLPLRVFEARYARLVADVTADGEQRRFGVIGLKSGFEVDNIAAKTVPATFASVGTIAEILEMETVSEGVYRLFLGGSQRFRIVRIVPSDKPYPLAEVSLLLETVGGELPLGLLESTQALADEFIRLYREFSDLEPRRDPDYPTEITLLAHRLAAEPPLSESDRQALLEDDNAVDRLRHLREVLRRELPLLRRTRTVSVHSGPMFRGLLPN
jgi:hypothetical protein